MTVNEGRTGSGVSGIGWDISIFLTETAHFPFKCNEN